MRLAIVVWTCSAVVYVASVWRQEPLLTLGAVIMAAAALLLYRRRAGL